MATEKVHSAVWRLAEVQHGVVARRQLLAVGLSDAAIKHRLARGRLHRIHRGVYAVGSPRLTERGAWMAAVLACGPKAVLSDGSAAALYGIRTSQHDGDIDVTVPPTGRGRRLGIAVHRRLLPPAHVGRLDRIPITSPALTLVHLASRLGSRPLETAVNEADKLGLVDAMELRRLLGELNGEIGVAPLRTLLDRHTFVLTDSELERRLLSLIRRAELPTPLAGRTVNGFKVDFFWPDLGLVVETDGLRYHRTPAEQAGDRLRDQRHTAAGLTTLRFTHRQVVREGHHVIATLKAVARRLEMGG
jgi:very-short-patch-repair endonuclease